jgi:hypothetical protein
MATKVRLEITMSEAMDEDFKTQIQFAIPGVHWTRIPQTHGTGHQSPKMGDPTWPQLNSTYIIDCSEDESSRILVVVKALREQYPDEGAACFKSYAEEL